MPKSKSPKNRSSGGSRRKRSQGRRQSPWRSRFSRWRTRFAPRRLIFAAALLLGLAGLGVAIGYVLADRLDASDRDAKAKSILEAMQQAAPGAEPRYARIEDLPDYRRYTENIPGQQRPSLEEPGRPAGGIARFSTTAQAWRRNAIPFRDDGRRPLIAIVIDDMGLDRSRTARIAALPAPLTLAWLPYARDLREQASAARARGHEQMLHMPMEPVSPSHNPGPGALSLSLGRSDLQARLRAALATYDFYVGLNNHMGSRFTVERAGMELVMQMVKESGLAFLDSRTAAGSIADTVAQEMAVPSAVRHVFLDDVDDIDSVRTQLAESERLARRQGFVIAIGHPHENTILALAQWLPTLPRKGLEQAPFTAVVVRRGRWQ